MSFLASHDRAMLCLDQGLGKTFVAARDAEFPALVVCPAHAKLVWRDEFAEERPEAVVQVVHAGDFFNDKADVWIINYDILRRTYLPPCATMICDESQYLSNPKALRTRKITAHAEVNARKVRLLSGTPMQRPIDLWSQLVLVRGTRMGWVEFGQRYSAGYLDEWNQWVFRGLSNEAELSDKLARCMVRIEKAEALPDLPPKLWSVVALDLPVDVRERDYSLESISRVGTPTPFEGLATLLRIQAELKLPSAIAFIEDLLRSERKVIVFAWHRETIKALATHFNALGVVTYNGDTSPALKATAQAKFQRDNAIRLFIGNIDAAGTALTLTAASAVVFVEGSWNPNKMDQCADRAHRIGQTSPVRSFILTVDQSIDHQMVRRCLEKMHVINQIVRPTMESQMSAHSKIAALFHALALEFQGLASQTGSDGPAPPTADPALPKPRTPKPKPEPVAAPAVTAQDIKAAGVAYINGHESDPAKIAARGAVMDIFLRFGANKADNLPAAALPAVLEALKALPPQVGAVPESDDL